MRWAHHELTRSVITAAKKKKKQIENICTSTPYVARRYVYQSVCNSRRSEYMHIIFIHSKYNELELESTAVMIRMFRAHTTTHHAHRATFILFFFSFFLSLFSINAGPQMITVTARRQSAFAYKTLQSINKMKNSNSMRRMANTQQWRRAI